MITMYQHKIVQEPLDDLLRGTITAVRIRNIANHERLSLK